MKLVYMWIEDFRVMKNLSLNFYHKFRFEFDGQENLIFSKLDNNDFIEEYYPSNQYYNMIVGKNGSGKSSILDLLYRGVNESIDMKTDRANIKDRFFSIFFDEEDNKFYFYGAKNEKDIKEGINKIGLENEYFDKLPICLLDIRNSSNIYENLNYTNDIFKEKLLISDDIKQNECLNKILNRLKNSLEPENIKFYGDTIYKNTQKCIRHKFIQKFLLNYEFYKELNYQDKDIELPKYFYIKLNFPPKKYYENIFKDIKNDYTDIYNAILKLYDYVVDKDKLDFLKKIQTFYIIYMCEQFIYYSTDKNIFIDVLQQIKFTRLVNSLEELGHMFVDDLLYSVKKQANSLNFNPFDNLKILQQEHIMFILEQKNQEYKDMLIFNLELQRKNINNITTFIVFYDQLFTLGQDYIEFDFDPPLSSGHKQIFKIFNYILEGIENLENKMDSYSRNILLVLDEPDLNLHYEWQRNFIKWLSIFLSQFEDINFQALITTHSAFMLSDIPKENVIALDKEENEVKIKNLQKSTLAQNLFVLLNDDFFINSFLGGYITDRLKELIDKYKSNGKITSNDIRFIENIGEEIIKKSLETKLKANK